MADEIGRNAPSRGALPCPGSGRPTRLALCTGTRLEAALTLYVHVCITVLPRGLQAARASLHKDERAQDPVGCHVYDLLSTCPL
mmetsp:Transcript_6416/g.19413  ORF Transcript_6416/g.19413 Transcript_6416/m.19413 type:complete len:84 (+) Transcript_6416:834-1085(+)